jgi:hypothetical protein
MQSIGASLTWIPALCAGAYMGAPTMFGYRASYRSAVRQTLVEFERLLDEVERRIQRDALAIQSA